MLTLEYKGRKISIIISDELINRLLEAFYPDKGMFGISKGYIELVKFFYGE